MSKSLSNNDKNIIENTILTNDIFQIKKLLQTAKEINRLFTKEWRLSDKEYELAIQKQEQATSIYDNLQGKWGIAHDAYNALLQMYGSNFKDIRSYIESDEEFLKIYKERSNEESIKSLELCYDENKIWVLVDKFKEFNINNNFIRSLSWDYKEINNMVWDNQFFLLAIAENLYKNAERFTEDRSSIHIFIRDYKDFIMISSSNISSEEFDEDNKEKIISGMWSIISSVWNNNQVWQGIYLFDLCKQLKDIWWKIDIMDSPLETWQYNIHIEITIPQ